MVNSKKMSKSSIAVIVLSILLVLSLILGFTGAWFTDKAEQEKPTNLKFGKVDIEQASSSFAATKKSAEIEGYDIMPGDTAHGMVDINNKYEAVYVKITVEAKDESKEEASVLELANVKFNGSDITKDADGNYYGEIAKETASTKFEFDVVLTGDKYDNTYQNKLLSFKVNVYAIQKANFDDVKTAFTTVTKIEEVK